jgi:hypothetical protein
VKAFSWFAVVSLLVGCSPTSSDELPLVGNCVTDFECTYGYECAAGGCQPQDATLYPHIKTASQLLRTYIDGDELAFRASHYDLFIGNPSPDEVRPINPHAELLQYVVSRFIVPQDVAYAEDWAADHGEDPEDLFLHYREDVTIPGRGSQVIVQGIPAGTVPGWNPGGGGNPASATERRQSRAVSFYLGSPAWYLANTGSPAYRRFIVDKCARLIDGTYYGNAFATGPVEGIMCDEAIYYAWVGDGMLEHTSEYYGITVTDEHPYPVSVETSYAALVQGLYDRFGSARDVMPNYGHALFLSYDNRSARNVQKITPWIWPQVWVSETGTSSPTSGNNRCITYEKDYEQAVAGIVRQTRGSARRVLGARDASNGLTGSDRSRLFTLGLYYLVSNLNTYYMYETTGPFSGPLSTWGWNPAVTYDVGAPARIPASVTDFDGKSNSTEHWLFATGPDPYNPGLTYRVFARRFGNALVLVKMLPEGSVIDDRSITTHALDGSYAVLQGDGNPGPVVTTATLRNNEALILIDLN